MEIFNDEAHDIKRMKGVIARVAHDGMKTFYVIKALQSSQVMSGQVGWMLRNGKFVPFDAQAAIRIPEDNQLLVLDQDIYVFSQSKLKSLFGYDAKEAYIAEKKVKEIEAHFKLSFAEGLTLQALVKGRRSTIKKLQKIEPTLMTQDQLLDHADEMGVEMMTDDAGAIIIMDEKDLVKFVNLLNDDYVESAVTGLRYEIKAKKPLKVEESNEELSMSPGALMDKSAEV
jgi:predicted peroxiredoxin